MIRLEESQNTFKIVDGNNKTIDTSIEPSGVIVKNESGVFVDAFNPKIRYKFPQELIPITNFEYEERLNESKRRIRLINRDYVSDVVAMLKQLQ